jgi:hypothetical protein
LIDPLTEAESLCRKSLEALADEHSPGIIATRNRLQELIGRIIESKKKIMVRSPQGRKLSEELRNNSARLYEAVASENRCEDLIHNQLLVLEDSVEKLEIYWKSFEYVTT